MLQIGVWKKAHFILKPGPKLDTGSMNGGSEQILFRKANRIGTALPPWNYQQDADEGAGALYSTMATTAADLVTLADWHQIGVKRLSFISIGKFKDSA